MGVARTEALSHAGSLLKAKALNGLMPRSPDNESSLQRLTGNFRWFCTKAKPKGSTLHSTTAVTDCDGVPNSGVHQGCLGFVYFWEDGGRWDMNCRWAYNTATWDVTCQKRTNCLPTTSYAAGKFTQNIAIVVPAGLKGGPVLNIHICLLWQAVTVRRRDRNKLYGKYRIFQFHEPAEAFVQLRTY